MADKEPKNQGFNYGPDSLIRDSGSLSFFTPLGTRNEVEHSITSGSVVAVIDRSECVPGIHVSDYQIVPGYSEDGASALNLASKKLYTFVRHQNSGSRNYDSPDLINYVFAVVSAICFLAEVERVYGVMHHFSSTNRFLGKRIVGALGFDYDDLESKMADFRELININVLKLQALKIPNTWPLLGRNLVYNTVVVKDGNIDKSQLYVMRSTVIWKYNETGADIGNLTPEYIFGGAGANILNLAGIKAIFDNIIAALVASEDINIMSGDILKAYGDSCVKLSTIAPDFTIEPVYNRDILETIHNAIYSEISTTSNDNTIIQDTNLNCLLYKPKAAASALLVTYTDSDGNTGYATPYSGKQYVDLYRDDVSPRDVINACAGKHFLGMNSSTLAQQAAGTLPIYITSFGTELFVRQIIYKDPSNATADTIYSYDTHNIATPSVSGGMLSDFARLGKFDWHPMIYGMGYDLGTNWLYLWNYTFGDLYNYSVIDDTEMNRIASALVMSGFGFTD